MDWLSWQPFRCTKVFSATTHRLVQHCNVCIQHPYRLPLTVFQSKPPSFAQPFWILVRQPSTVSFCFSGRMALAFYGPQTPSCKLFRCWYNIDSWLTATRTLGCIFGTIIVDRKQLIIPVLTVADFSLVMCTIGPLFPVAQYTLAVSFRKQLLGVASNIIYRNNSSSPRHATSPSPWPPSSSSSHKHSTTSSSTLSTKPSSPPPSLSSPFLKKRLRLHLLIRKHGVKWRKRDMRRERSLWVQ